MDTNRMKKASQWYYSQVFRDEAIRPRPCQSAEAVPPLIRTARSLENGVSQSWQSRESIFMKQGKLLANYEDDYAFSDNVVRYYPTYQALSDQELRGYFSWRTKLRAGDIRPAPLSFAFLYIYELINQIGVANALDGYQKLCAFRDTYSKLDDKILPYLSKWLTDYIVYYQLDPNLLADSQQVRFDRSIHILDSIRLQDEAKVLFAVKQLAPKWLSRSKFYAANQADCDRVIVRVLRRVSDHYATRCKSSMVEQYFGKCRQFPIRIFDTAVFADPCKIRNLEYPLDERCIYRCQNGLWSVTRHANPPRPSSKLEELMKTIDAIMREEYADKHPIQYEVETKWLVKLIREETQTLLVEKKAAEASKITIDYSQLARIRTDAAITQDKLMVEEDWCPEHTVAAELIAASPAQSDAELPTLPDLPLTPTELRLLRCLLQGEPTNWVQAEGNLLSVLVDSINEKLYDTFMDSVLDDTPELVEDYINDLKEMVDL